VRSDVDPEEETSEQVVGVSPPTVLPERFEDFEGFRETTLAVFTDPECNDLVRRFGELVYSMGQGSIGNGPHEPDGSFFHQARAVLADLRHLEGWLARLDGMRGQELLWGAEVPLSGLCGSLVPKLKAIADTLEAELSKLKAEE